MSDTASEEKLRRALLAEIITDRPKAHRVLFHKRRELGICPAQEEMIRDFHSAEPRIIDEAFRGFAKSTIGEEGMLIKAGLREFSYGIILGNTYERAAQRLASIKREIDRNRAVHLAFGDLKGPTWNEGKVQLSNGVVLQVFGARQSIRGAKEESRPDFVLIDDLEDKEWVANEKAVEENARWFAADFLPALADQLRTPIRYLGTPLAENCLLRRLAKSGEWKHCKYPVKYRDVTTGEWVATWPEKHDLAYIDRMEASFKSILQHREFMQEYMLESESQEELAFLPKYFVYGQKVRTYQAVYAMIDPARTTNVNTSATTGRAVWSWAPGGRLDIWECGGEFLKPDQIIEEAFRINEVYAPVEIGFETNGLEEWALQQFRVAQSKRGTLPLVPVRAPRGKLDFIRGLQGYFSAGAAVFQGQQEAFAEAVAQFLSFPRGRIDAPNALAFAQLMRPGEPVYPDFSVDCVYEGEGPVRQAGCFLAMNADGARVTAALVQEHQGVIRVIADWVADGQPFEVVEGIVRAASREANGRVVPVLGPTHYDRYRNLGLAAALARVPLPATPGSAPEAGQAMIREALQRHIRGLPAVQVSSQATWTLRALAGGYALPLLAGNMLASEPKEGIYKCLMQGIEAFAGSLAFLREDDRGGNWRETRDGRRYRSALK